MRKISLTIVLGVLISIATASPVAAGLSDREVAAGNRASAGTLDLVLTSPVSIFASGITPGTGSGTGSVTVSNSGSVAADYRLKFVKTGGDDAFCDALNLTASKGSTQVYNGSLSALNIFGGTLTSAGTHDWRFVVSLPTGAPDSLSGKSCTFDIEFAARQSGLSTGGFSDKEVLGDSIVNAGTWSSAPTAPVSTFGTPEKGVAFYNTPIIISGTSVAPAGQGIESVKLTYANYVNGSCDGTFNDPGHEIIVIYNSKLHSPFSWVYGWVPAAKGVYCIKASAKSTTGVSEQSPIVENITFDPKPLPLPYLSFTPGRVDTSSGPKSVEVSLKFSKFPLQTTPVIAGTGSSIVLQSPNSSSNPFPPNNLFPPNDVGAFFLSPPTPDGTYKTTLVFSQNSDVGQWKVKGLLLLGTDGSQAFWSYNDLIGQGLPASVESGPDTDAPVISDIKVTFATPKEANSAPLPVVTWKTDENATSRVLFGGTSVSATGAGDKVSDLTGSYTYDLPKPEDTTADRKEHSVKLEIPAGGVVANTYYYRVVSKDAAGNERMSPEQTFSVDWNSAAGSASPGQVVLNEIMPDPTGADSVSVSSPTCLDGGFCGEWVELYNTGTNDVDVVGWRIKDTSGKSWKITTNPASGDAFADNDGDLTTAETVVPAGGFLVVYRNGESMSLNNTGAETVKLYDAGWGKAAVLMDSHSFTDADFREGKSIARFPDGTGPWFDPKATPGGENELTEQERVDFRRQAFDICFDGEKLRDRGDDPLCNPVFLEFVDMIDSAEDKKLSASARKEFLPAEEKEPSEKAVRASAENTPQTTEDPAAAPVPSRESTPAAAEASTEEEVSAPEAEADETSSESEPAKAARKETDRETDRETEKEAGEEIFPENNTEDLLEAEQTAAGETSAAPAEDKSATGSGGGSEAVSVSDETPSADKSDLPEKDSAAPSSDSATDEVKSMPAEESASATETSTEEKTFAPKQKSRNRISSEKKPKNPAVGEDGSQKKQTAKTRAEKQPEKKPEKSASDPSKSSAKKTEAKKDIAEKPASDKEKKPAPSEDALPPRKSAPEEKEQASSEDEKAVPADDGSERSAGEETQESTVKETTL